MDYNKNKCDNSKNKLSYPLLYINLNRSIDRREWIQKDFHNHNINYIRIMAIDGDTIPCTSAGISANAYTNANIDIDIDTDSDEIEKIKFIDNIRNGSNMQIACTLSHLKAIKTAYYMGIEVALILEDDTNISDIDKWTVSYASIVENAPHDWDIIQLYTSNRKILGLIESGSIELEKYIYHNNIANNNGINSYYSTGCYIINKKGMMNILNKYYDETTDTYILTGINVIVEELLYRHVVTYFYTLPTVSTYDNKFNSIIKNRRNRDGFFTSDMIMKFYRNKPNYPP